MARKRTKKLESQVLAEGEVTNHSHRVVEGDVALFETDEPDVRELDVETKALLTHEEHRPLTLEPGSYEVHGIQTWSYEKQMAQRVRD